MREGDGLVRDALSGRREVQNRRRGKWYRRLIIIVASDVFERCGRR